MGGGSKGGAPKGGAPKGGGPNPGKVGPRRVGRRVGPRRVGAPKGGGPKISRFFFPVPPQIVLFFPLWGSSRGIWVMFEAPGRSNVHVWSSRAVMCEPRPGLVGPPGFHTTVREPKRAHLRVPVFKNTTKVQREEPQREKKERNFRWEREKKDRNFGRSRGRAVRRRGVRGRGPKILNRPTTHTPTSTTNKHHQQAPPTGTNRHQQAPTGTNRHHQQALTRNNNNQEQQHLKIWPKHKNTQIGQMRSTL